MILYDACCRHPRSGTEPIMMMVMMMLMMMMMMIVLMHTISGYLSVQGTKDDSVLAVSRLPSRGPVH